MHVYLIKKENIEGFSSWRGLFCLVINLCFVLVTWVAPIMAQNETPPPIKYKLFHDESNKSHVLRFEWADSSTNWNVYLSGAEHPIAGKKRRLSEGFEFYPLVGFQAETHYEVRQKGNVLFTFVPQVVTVSAPNVLAIFPSGEHVPENLLKIYVHFSEPMSSASPYPFISLLDGKRDTLRDVFLLQEPPLWNKDRTQFTLWLDPGRIKTDLELNRRFGSPLRAHKTYHLIISPTMKSARGVALQTAVEKKWKTGERDERQPQPQKWMIEPPQNQSLQALKVISDEPLDYGSSWGRMQIVRSGELVQGSWKTGSAELIWYFVPQQPWQKGDYQLLLDERIEDLAGNNLVRIFDVDLKKDQDVAPPILELSFSIAH